MVNTINDVLRTKGSSVVTIKPVETVYAALELMSLNNIGAVVVLDGESVVGILSEREYARKVVLEGRSSLKTPVNEIMNVDNVSVTPNMKIEDALELMTDKRCRHLLVKDNDSLVGVVSIGDLVFAIIQNQKFKINQLEGIIST